MASKNQGLLNEDQLKQVQKNNDAQRDESEKQLLHYLKLAFYWASGVFVIFGVLWSIGVFLFDFGNIVYFNYATHFLTFFLGSIVYPLTRKIVRE